MDLILGTAVTLFILLDPFGNLAVFNTVLSKCPEQKRQSILVRELLIALAVLLFFLLCGRPALDFLHLRDSTLRVSGGIILFLVAIGMVFPAKSLLGGEDDQEPFIVPLAIPLVAGPSALIFLLLLSSQHQAQLGHVTLATVAAWFVSSAILLASPFFMRFLGKKGTRALERLMGMILVMIAVQMFMDGLADYPVNQ